MDLGQIGQILDSIGKVASVIPVPQAELAGQLAVILGGILQRESARTGETTDQILTRAGVALDRDVAELMKDIAAGQ